MKNHIRKETYETPLAESIIIERIEAFCQTSAFDPTGVGDNFQWGSGSGIPSGNGDSFSWGN